MDSGRLDAVPTGAVHLDTVRALHQTVVSLRTALEVSKNELKELKEKYKKHSHCIDYDDVIEKLTLENHILRRRIIDSGFEPRGSSQNIKLEVTYSPRSQIADDYSEVVIKTATTDCRNSATPEVNTVLETEEQIFEGSDEHKEFCSTDPLNNIAEERAEENLSAELSPNSLEPEYLSPEVSPENDRSNTQIEELNTHISHYSVPDTEAPNPSFKTKLELLSKFDVRIKVRTIKEGTIISSTSSDTDSAVEDKADKETEKDSEESKVSYHFEEKKEHFENIEDLKGSRITIKSISSENIKMAVPNEAEVKNKVDKLDVQVRITSEENLVVKEGVERSRRKDTLNLDVDNLSLRSLSEGDNSVFSETGTTPGGPGMEEREDQASGNESEEVDDIELIFTTDESKDMSNLQEDLVSIRETDTWGPPSGSTTHSTPVLIKFHTLDPDFQPGESSNENQENIHHKTFSDSLKMKRVSLPSDNEIKRVAFNGKGALDLPGRGILKSCDNKSETTLYKRSPNVSSRGLDSVDSLTCDYYRGLSFDNTKSSSFELGSSMDMLTREESVDSFQRTGLGHRFSVFAETDISKCGISEDDISANMHARRNTCPNPFQYRPLIRGPRGPVRPVRGRPGRDACARCDGAAQTELSALPPRWTSDGHLAYKMCAGAPPTLPQRMGSRRPAEPRPSPPETDETRRVLLSDIGFTSMVPELSRSADPVWALERRLSQQDSAPAASLASKLVSRGAYRSPSARDWPAPAHLPHYRDHRSWRTSLPDVRDDTDELLYETETYLRRSIDNLRDTSIDVGMPAKLGKPYIPTEPRQLRLGHTVKLITPNGRIVVGRVRYVGVAGGAGPLVGAETRGAGHSDGTLRGRRYFLAAPGHAAVFVPFNKLVMAWES